MRSSSSSSPLSFLLVGIFAVLTVVFVGLSMSYRSKFNTLLTDLDVSSSKEAVAQLERVFKEQKRLQKQVDQTRADTQRKFAQQISNIEKENRHLQKERDELRVKYENPEKLENDQKLVAKEQAWRDQVNMLMDYTRQESKRSVLDR